MLGAGRWRRVDRRNQVELRERVGLHERCRASGTSRTSTFTPRAEDEQRRPARAAPAWTRRPATALHESDDRQGQCSCGEGHGQPHPGDVGSGRRRTALNRSLRTQHTRSTDRGGDDGDGSADPGAPPRDARTQRRGAPAAARRDRATANSHVQRDELGRRPAAGWRSSHSVGLTCSEHQPVPERARARPSGAHAAVPRGAGDAGPVRTAPASARATRGTCNGVGTTTIQSGSCRAPNFSLKRWSERNPYTGSRSRATRRDPTVDDVIVDAGSWAASGVPERLNVRQPCLARPQGGPGDEELDDARACRRRRAA